MPLIDFKSLHFLREVDGLNGVCFRAAGQSWEELYLFPLLNILICEHDYKCT